MSCQMLVTPFSSGTLRRTCFALLLLDGGRAWDGRKAREKAACHLNGRAPTSRGGGTPTTPHYQAVKYSTTTDYDYKGAHTHTTPAGILPGRTWSTLPALPTSTKLRFAYRFAAITAFFLPYPPSPRATTIPFERWWGAFCHAGCSAACKLDVGYLCKFGRGFRPRAHHSGYCIIVGGRTSLLCCAGTGFVVLRIITPRLLTRKTMV